MPTLPGSQNFDSSSRHVGSQVVFIWVQLLSFPNGTLLAFLPRITRIFTNFSLTFVSIRAIRGEMPPGETRAFTPYSYCPLTHRGRAENPQGRSVALVAALTGCWGRDDTRQLQAERVQSSRGGRPPCRPQPGLPVGSKTRPTRVCAILYRGSPESRDDLPPTEEACLSWQAS